MPRERSVDIWTTGAADRLHFANRYDKRALSLLSIKFTTYARIDIKGMYIKAAHRPAADAS
jgi:hypothetical protein